MRDLVKKDYLVSVNNQRNGHWYSGSTEVAGPIGQLNDKWTPGYGFTAIIVATLGRLKVFAVVLASLLLALLYLGGESVQVTMQLPKSVSQVFQGLLLLYLLACDVLIQYQIKFRNVPNKSSLNESKKGV
jgi:simple sugar transport system permease protein